jgi:PAS domain S-box-containing protein
MSFSIRSLRPPRNVAIVACAVILAAIPLFLGNKFPILLLGVALAAWYGGWLASLCVTAVVIFLAVVGIRSQTSPSSAADVTYAGLLNFAVLALLINLLTAALKRTQKQSELDAAALGRGKESYRLLFDANPHPMWVYDTETLKFLAVNEAATLSYGYSREDFLAMTIGDIRPADDVPALRERVSTHDNQTFLNSSGWRHIRKNGDLINVEISSHPMEMEGRPARLVMAMDVTERQRAQEALHRSEDRSRRLVESNLIGVAFLDRNGQVVDANDAFLTFSAYTREDLAKRDVRWDRLIGEHPVEPAGVLSDSSIGRWETARFEADFIRADGSRVPTLFGVARLEEGAAEEAICFTLDLTGLRRAERERDRLLAAEQAARGEAEASERRYRILTHAIPQIVWMAGPDGEAYYFNPRWSVYSGLDKARSQGLGWQSALHPDDVQRFRVIWAKALEARQGLTIDLRLRGANGTYRWHLLRVICTGSGESKDLRWIGTFTDINDQKWAAGAFEFLAEATAVLASSLDYEKTLERVARLAVPHIADICQIDMIDQADGVLRRVAASRNENSVEGKVRLANPRPAGPPPSHPAYTVLQTGRPKCDARPSATAPAEQPGDAAVWDSFGDPGVICYISVPLESRERVLGVVSFAMTSSGRRYGRADLPLAEQLARRAAVSVDNARLYLAAEQARKEAEIANLAKDRFLAVLSHELRTPLNPVLLTSSALLDDPSTPASLRPMLELTRRNVQLEARLIGDLLDVSRIGAGKMHFAREVVDAHDVIRQSLEICAEDVREAGLNLKVELKASEHHVNADPTRLQQVVWNLAKNAAKFTPAGGQLIIRSHNPSSPNEGSDQPRLVIEVQDTGIGIDPTLLTKVFDAFEQGDARTTGRTGGLGLGLAISRAVVEAHGGRLAASSLGKDQGTTFTLELPTTTAPVSRVWPTPDAQSTPSSPLSLLLVEDNKDTLRTLSWALERRGHVVVATDSMNSALEAASVGHFDLVISDIELPDGNGLELISRIGRDGALPGIAMSGYGSEEDIQQSLSAGFTEHLTKPVSFQDLEKAIRHVAAVSSTIDAGQDPVGH